MDAAKKAETALMSGANWAIAGTIKRLTITKGMPTCSAPNFPWQLTDQGRDAPRQDYGV
ncbi:hypothetical protein [Rhizobium gallicum]|uniref:hypothetical protein n=1 Tax=Rhizobium gallicum TaxID=56730 RepID=UPI001416FEA3|nr:hypothetical protein [Rhizobium gallicum]